MMNKRIKSLAIASLITLVTLLVYSNACAQSFNRKTKGFPKTETLKKSSIITGEQITVEAQTFDIINTENGSKFVWAISKAGKEYPVWIGEITEYKYEELPVYKTKKGNFCAYKLNKSGYPYPVWLSKNSEKEE